MKKVFLVTVIESERGWGKKIDDYMVCQNEDDAKIFIYEFNLENNKVVVPDWYMMAESKLIEKEIKVIAAI